VYLERTSRVFENCRRLQAIEEGFILEILGNIIRPLGQTKMVNKHISQHLKELGHERRVEFATFSAKRKGLAWPSKQENVDQIQADNVSKQSGVRMRINIKILVF
jgi:hypothetical protein